MPVIQFWARRIATLGLLVLAAACGGGGDGASSPVFAGPSKVFASDEVNGAIGSTEQSNPAPGTTLTITKIITGSSTQIPVGPGCFRCLPSLALDSARDQLYVSTRDNTLVFNNAGTATGNIAPSRTLTSIVAGIGRHLQLNTTTDILYVSLPGGAVLRVDNASTANALTTASRTFNLSPFTPGNDTITDIALDATHDVLYVGFTRNSAGSVGIIHSISAQVSGTVALDAEITVNAVVPAITIDGPRDKLYIGNQSGQILVYDNASTRTTGAPPPNRTITLPFVTQFRPFIETTNDRLYASGQARVVILNNASTATGAVATSVVQVSTTNSDLTAVVARP